MQKLFLIFIVGVCIFFVGCKSLEEKQQILMWLVGSESQAKVIQRLGEEFFKNKGFKFGCEAISWEGAYTKYITCIAGGVTPDIGTMGISWGIEFGSRGALVDLNLEFPRDLKIIKEKNFPGIWNSIEYKEKVYGIPFDLSVQIIFYRKDIISHVPKNWQELEDLLRNLKKQGKGMIFDWGSMSWIGFSPFLWQAGGDFYDSEGTHSILDSESAFVALDFFRRLYVELGVPTTPLVLEQGMRTGDFPIAISGNWKIDALRLCVPEIKGKWSIAVLPKGPTGKNTAFLGGRIIGIFNKSKYKKEAWEFIKFLFEPQIQLRLYEAARLNQDSYLPSNTETWSILPMEKEFKEVLELQVKEAKGPPAVIGWDKSTRFIEEAIQKVVLEGRDVKEELKKAKGLFDQSILIN